MEYRPPSRRPFILLLPVHVDLLLCVSTQLEDWLAYEDDTGMTVLHVAAGTGSVKVLCSHNSDL